ncbi:cytochrome P450 6B5 [Helicoverpa armigera]|uniref:cytochrome P450 6B5 n=1 Tax=Helicoverpa armigera TaxID=29058 RepID=UPI003083D3C0
MFLPIILSGLVVLLTWYVMGKRNENYWKSRGVKFYGKNKVTGPFWDYFTTQGALFETFNNLYNEFRKEPAVGLGQILTPSLFVIDAKNVQHVLAHDFQSFYHRGFDPAEDDQLADSITMMNGPRWKLMRKSMTPLFTANKLKNMYYTMDKSAQDFVDYLKANPNKWNGDFYNSAMLYCNAAICSAIFGIGTKSTFDSPFLEVARNISFSGFKNNMKFALLSLAPSLMKTLGVKLFKDYEDFFIGAIGEVIKNKEKGITSRNDFADLCISLQKNGTLKDPTTGYEMEPTTGLLAAQAFFFFSAGVEPTAAAIFSTFYCMARHPDVLEKVHQEIDEHFEKHNGQITYNVISEMEYVDKVINEAMRIFPPIGVLTRKCVQDTVLPVGNIKVEKGSKLFTPIYAMHHDPTLYPDPEVFDPERFSKDRKPNDDIYMPFGMGNRTCIGNRYAKLQMAACVVQVLRAFTVKGKQLKGKEKLTFERHALLCRPDDMEIHLIPRPLK